MEFIDDFEDEHPHRIVKPMTLIDLVNSILNLEKSGVISFEEFTKLSFESIHEEYFPMAHSTQIIKAVIKINDLKQGKTTPSSLTQKRITFKKDHAVIDYITSYF